ncbi:Uncharacterised protein [Serratia entomophila]|uniref:hypothetical protein n=1 Tax=Serratia entomophila TaxID=42906 RepID=UPI00217B5A4C|nr:hypothetical protein [Serratia entomophila]CAI0734102.1 Uncharacterised protein [Serratia entomophila]CAI1659569.1 Uncharacterised protein [Serratia entomophila]
MRGRSAAGLILGELLRDAPVVLQTLFDVVPQMLGLFGLHQRRRVMADRPPDWLQRRPGRLTATAGMPWRYDG